MPPPESVTVASVPLVDARVPVVPGLQAPPAVAVDVDQAVLLVLQPVYLVEGLHAPDGGAEGVGYQHCAVVDLAAGRVDARVVEDVVQDVARRLGQL